MFNFVIECLVLIKRTLFEHNMLKNEHGATLNGTFEGYRK